MLSVSQIRETQRRRRSPYSDKQHYHEYILQRIEGYKNSIGRDELLRLGDEAALELHATSEGQFVLTEVLMLESVDRLIVKRLALRSYRRWRQQFIKLREAQRTPTHWGMEPTCVLARLLPRVEPEDQVLVLGSGAEGATYLLAAYDAAVTFVAGDLGSVERVESRMAAEALASIFDAFVAPIGGGLPVCLDFVERLDIVVIDPSTLSELTRGALRSPGRPAAAQSAGRRARHPRQLPRARARCLPVLLRRVDRGRAPPPPPRPSLRRTGVGQARVSAGHWRQPDRRVHLTRDGHPPCRITRTDTSV